MREGFAISPVVEGAIGEHTIDIYGENTNPGELGAELGRELTHGWSSA